MAEFCLECWNKITGTQEPDGKFLFSRVPDLCEGCGEWKPVIIRLKMFFASTFSFKMQIDFLKVAWGISPVLHFLRRHSFGCRRGAVAGIQSLLVTDM